MTRLINIDNGGTLTDFCLVDGDEVRYTKTLTTPYDLSRCLFDGLTKVSELAYSELRLAALLQSTDWMRYSTAQGTNPRFLFNADRRLRDARARQPSRIFRWRLTACSPVAAEPDAEAVMKQVRSLARPVAAWAFKTPLLRSSL